MIKLPLPDNNTKPTNWAQLYGSSLALSIVEASKSYTDGPVVILVEDIAHADTLRSEIAFYSSSNQVI